jgi:O-antigen ligase
LFLDISPQVKYQETKYNKPKFRMKTNNRVYHAIQWVLWGLMILSLPITSFPPVARVLGATVSPAAIIPFALLALVWWLPALLRRAALPGQSLPLLAFMGVALLSCLAALFRDIPPFYDIQPWREMLQAFATLLIGVAFYLLAAVWPNNEKRLSFTLCMLNYTGLILLGWCLVQWIYGQPGSRWPGWINPIQLLFSTVDLYKGRVTGFAFEPSWLSHQVNMLFLPFWLSASVMGYTAHKRKLAGISMENFMLAAGVVLLYLSKSRLGLLAFLLCVFFLLILLSVRLVRRWQSRFASRAARLRVVFFFYGGLLLLAVLLLVGTGVYLSKTDPRMADLFDIQTLRERGFLQYAENLAFAARIVYWQAGWDVFNQYPLLGVGLGNAGFYFHDSLDPAAWEFMEVRAVMYEQGAVPNVKSLWVRLLAETGLVGFGVFAAWLVVMAATGVTLLKRSGKPARLAGLAVILTLIGLLVEGFSVDTFALPYYWITLGLGTAVYHFGKHEADTQE